jgi:hypothetical protein
MVGAGISKGRTGMVEKPLSPQEALNKQRTASFRALRGEGVVLPPSDMVERGSDMMGSIGGKAAMQQQASLKNAPTWNRLAREEIGLKGALPITDKTLDAVRSTAYEPYDTIQRISREAKTKLEKLKKDNLTAPGGHELAVQEAAAASAMNPLMIQAAADVDALKLARFKSSKAYDAFKAGNPAAYETWQAAKAEADRLNENIFAAAESIGDKNLVKRLNEARTLIAKSYSIQRAINPGSGLVDPSEFGRQLRDREPLSGNLKKIGDFQLSYYKDAVEAGRVPAPGVNNLQAQIGMAMASQEGGSGKLMGAINSTIGKPVRAALLSETMQDRYAKPLTVAGPENILDTFARVGGAAGGRNIFLPNEDERDAEINASLERFRR